MQVLELIQSFGFTPETLVDKFKEAVKSSIYEKFNLWPENEKMAVVITVSMNGKEAMLTYNYIATVNDCARTVLIEVGVFSDLIIKLFDSADLMTRSAIELAMSKFADGLSVAQCATMFDGFAAAALESLPDFENGLCFYLDAGGALGCNGATLLPSGVGSLGVPFDVSQLFGRLVGMGENA